MIEFYQDFPVLVWVVGYLLIGLTISAFRKRSLSGEYLVTRLLPKELRRSMRFTVDILITLTWPWILLGWILPKSPRYRSMDWPCACGGYFVTSKLLIKQSRKTGIVVSKCKGCKKYVGLPVQASWERSPQDQKEEI